MEKQRVLMVDDHEKLRRGRIIWQADNCIRYNEEVK